MQWRTLIKDLFCHSSPEVTGIISATANIGVCVCVYIHHIIAVHSQTFTSCISLSSSSFILFTVTIVMRTWLHLVPHSSANNSLFCHLSLPLCWIVLFRTKLTSAAEKESIAMFVRNLRQRLLVCPVRGCVIMGVDPGYKHGCKLAILSPTSK